MNLFGPALIEVENESGLSNFVPILVGDREICEEMAILLQKFDATLSSQEQLLSCLRPECEVHALRRALFSEFVLDVGWLLRNPISGQPSTSSSENDFWVTPTSDGTLYSQSSQNQSICCSSHESGCTKSSGEYIHGLTSDEGLSCQFLC